MRGSSLIEKCEMEGADRLVSWGKTFVKLWSEIIHDNALLVDCDDVLKPLFRDSHVLVKYDPERAPFPHLAVTIRSTGTKLRAAAKLCAKLSKDKRPISLHGTFVESGIINITTSSGLPFTGVVLDVNRVIQLINDSKDDDEEIVSLIGDGDDFGCDFQRGSITIFLLPSMEKQYRMITIAKFMAVQQLSDFLRYNAPPVDVNGHVVQELRSYRQMSGSFTKFIEDNTMVIASVDPRFVSAKLALMLTIIDTVCAHLADIKKPYALSPIEGGNNGDSPVGSGFSTPLSERRSVGDDSFDDTWSSRSRTTPSSARSFMSSSTASPFSPDTSFEIDDEFPDTINITPLGKRSIDTNHYKVGPLIDITNAMEHTPGLRLFGLLTERTRVERNWEDGLTMGAIDWSTLPLALMPTGTSGSKRETLLLRITYNYEKNKSVQCDMVVNRKCTLEHAAKLFFQQPIFTDPSNTIPGMDSGGLTKYSDVNYHEIYHPEAEVVGYLPAVIQKVSMMLPGLPVSSPGVVEMILWCHKQYPQYERPFYSNPSLS